MGAQLTRFDRWLRERFVYETHVYTLRAPEAVPPGVIVEEMPEEAGRRYRHRMVIRDSGQVDGVISALRASGQMFTTRVVDRGEWYVPFLAPKDKSFTWRLFWWGVSLVIAFFLIRLGISLWNNQELRKNVIDAFKLFKG